MHSNLTGQPSTTSTLSMACRELQLSQGCHVLISVACIVSGRSSLCNTEHQLTIYLLVASLPVSTSSGTAVKVKSPARMECNTVSSSTCCCQSSSVGTMLPTDCKSSHVSARLLPIL